MYKRILSLLSPPWARWSGGALIVLVGCAAVWLIAVWQPPAGPAALASAHPLATRAGVEMLTRGGNAFDAAVAMSAALAVVEPYASGLGGGGFWLLHDAKAKGAPAVMLDGREKAALAARADMYLDAAGEVVAGASIDGARAAAIPGLPAALVWLADNYGKLPLSVTLAPAIDYAETGFAVDARYRQMLMWRLDAVAASPAAAAIFLADGQPPAEGTLLVQTDLARTLKLLAKHGHEGFYAGEVAENLVHGVQQAGGIWTLQDLQQYEVKVRTPVTLQYRDMKLTAAALPSSGGLALAQSLNILAGYDWEELGEVDKIHLIIEAWRRAYRDRAEYLGDPDFVSVPQAQLLSPQYAAGLRQSIRLDRTTRSANLAATYTPQSGGDNTTHFSVIDRQGNRVAATLSLNYPFGSGFVAPSTGVLLNDEMDDFSLKPGAPNVYGLVGAEANAIAAEKRMLSSMSPTFVETAQRVGVLGTPGGSRIISMVLLGSLAFEQAASAQQIVDQPRFHHQYLPDEVQFEPGALSPVAIRELTRRGHSLRPVERPWGNMQVVIFDKTTGQFSAAADARGQGQAQVLP